MATAGAGRGTGPERAWARDLPGEAEVEVVLDAEESGHLVRSRRVRVGDPVVLFDGRGAAREGRVLQADPRACRVALGAPAPDRTPRVQVRLAVAPPETASGDRMVGMLAELGVARLAPLRCERADPGRLERAVARAERWRRLAREACKVNGCARALQVDAPIDLAAAAAEGAVLLDPDPAAPRLRAAAWADAGPWILVGPEGGFTAGERDRAGRVACLGRPALRTATAAVAAAAVLLAGDPGPLAGDPPAA